MNKLITLFFLNFLTIHLYADTLVIPSKDSDSTDYFRFCSKPGYICSTHYYLQLFNLKKSDRFEQLITKIDLTDPSFVNQLPEWIQSLITSEPLSEEQAEALKDLCSKSFEMTKNRVFKSLADSINQALIAIKLNPSLDTESYAVYNNDQTYFLIFKKILTEQEYQNNKLKFGSIATYRFRYNQNLINIHSKTTYLIDGDCSNYKLNTSLPINQQVLPFFKSSCSFSESFTNGLSKTSQFAKENKSTLTWLGIATLAFIISQKYEVELNF